VARALRSVTYDARLPRMSLAGDPSWSFIFEPWDEQRGGWHQVLLSAGLSVELVDGSDSLAAVRSPRLKKALGQHHLVSGSLCRPLIDFLEPSGQRVVEVGPGGGVLTGELLAAGARVLAWEVDIEWAAELLRRRRAGSLSGGADGQGGDGQGGDGGWSGVGRGQVGGGSAGGAGGRREGEDGQLAIVVEDALDLPWGRLPAPTLAAGNLPYNIATALLGALLPHHERVPRAAFLVQREVAERLLARPGDPAYGSFSVLAAAYARAVSLGRVRRGSFRPPPKVEGAYVGFELRPPPVPDGEMPAFLATVRLAFGQRRKTLRNALAAGWGRERAGAVLAAMGLPDDVRAERLGLEELLELHRCGQKPDVVVR
jgi:16S rRNA (adenine1518-N6/adenine1519-N6)-dimethyltransferase